MDKFVIIKSINPGWVAPSPKTTTTDTDTKSTTDETKKDNKSGDIKKDDIKDQVKDEAKKDETKKEEPKKKRAPRSTTTSKSTKKSNDTKSADTTSTTTTTTTTDSSKPTPKQTLVSHWFQVSDTPTYKFLFEKEAADRAEEERKRAERQAKEDAIAAEKKKQLQKQKLEAKKKRDALRKQKQEEEWEEYLAMQEKTTKGIEIIPHLYLGSFLAAKNIEWLQEASVSKIVNVTSEVPSYFLNKKDKENDKVINEKDIDKFIVDDDDDEEDEDDDEEEDSDEESDGEEGEEESGEEEEEEGEEVNIVDEKVDEEMQVETTTTIVPTTTTTTIDQVKEDKKVDEEMKVDTTTVAPTTTTTTIDQANEDKKVDDKMQVETTATTVPTTTTTIDQVNEEVQVDEKVKIDIKYLRISIADSPRSKIENYFEEAIKFINEGNGTDGGNDKSNVLIHCKQGRSRSPSIVIAYLMSNEKWTLEKSFNHIESVSPKGLTVNDGFKKKLMDYELKLFGENSINFFDRKNRSSRALTSSLPTSRTTTPKKTVNKKQDSDDDSFEIDTSATTVSITSLEIEDDASIIDELKIVKRRKNVICDDDDE